MEETISSLDKPVRNNSTEVTDKLKPQSDGLDDFRLSINKDDFKAMDTSNIFGEKTADGALTLDEINSALETGLFKTEPQKLEAVQAFQKHLEEGEKNKPKLTFGDFEIETKATISSWFTADFARERIDSNLFGKIDIDGNNSLTGKEIDYYKARPELSKMDKHTLNVLGDEDQELKENGGIKSWFDENEESVKSGNDKFKVQETKKAFMDTTPFKNDGERKAFEKLASAFENRMTDTAIANAMREGKPVDLDFNQTQIQKTYENMAKIMRMDPDSHKPMMKFMHELVNPELINQSFTGRPNSLSDGYYNGAKKAPGNLTEFVYNAKRSLESLSKLNK